MKLRVFRRDHVVMAVAAVMFALGLVAVNVIWLKAFGVFIAIGGVVGALMAADLGKTEIMCTIHPKNEPSESLFRLLGYRRVATVSTSYGKRVVFARKLPLPNEQWAR